MHTHLVDELEAEDSSIPSKSIRDMTPHGSPGVQHAVNVIVKSLVGVGGGERGLVPTGTCNERKRVAAKEEMLVKLEIAMEEVAWRA